MNPSAPARYRPDIDGLRAVAVLSVIAFHVDARLVPGGFAGVDIFFVISGFLITGIVVDDVRSGAFSFRAFYARRMRRLGPALAVVVLATLGAGILLLLPEDLMALARSALAAMAFVANIFFEQTVAASYFAPATNTIPLLHLWSLGVEEQFYLAWPVALVIAARWLSPRQLLAMALLVAAGSLLLSQHEVGSDPMRGYYGLPSRVFELLAGAAVAFAVRAAASPPRRAVREALALVGAGAVAFSLAFVGEDGFPGLAALPVTVGTALVLVAGAGGATFVGRVLSLRLLVGIGLISYSLYLWHWPILAFLRYLFPVLSPAMAIGAVVATFVLSIASYRLVERPARRAGWSFARVAAAFALIPAAGVAAVSFWLVGTDGYGPYGAAYREALAETRRISAPAYAYPYVCQDKVWKTADLDRPACVINPSAENGAKPRTLLWGDSHAAHYIGVVGAIAERAGFALRDIVYSSCPPLLAPTKNFGEAPYVEACARAQRFMETGIDRFRTVILAAAWQSYAPRPGFAEEVRATVTELRRRGHPVILLGQVPSMPGFDRRCEQKAIKAPVLDCRAVLARVAHRPAPFNATLAEIAGSIDGVSYFDIDVVTCADGTCSAYLGGEPVYFDRQHLSMAGSWAVGRALVERFGVPAAFRLAEEPAAP